MKCKWSLLVGTIAAVAYVLPSTAAADTATFGSTLQASQNVSILTQSALQLRAASPSPLAAPANGLIIRWAVRSGDSGSQYLFAVLHPVPGTGIGSGFTVTSIASGTPVPDFSDSVRTYDQVDPYVTVEKGDSIGLSNNMAGALPFHQSGNSQDVYAPYSGRFLPPGTIYAAPSESSGSELLLQATERFCAVPDLRRERVGTARQQLAAHDCQAQVVQKNVKAKRKKKRVLRQLDPPGTTALPGQFIRIVVGKLRRIH